MKMKHIFLSSLCLIFGICTSIAQNPDKMKTVNARVSDNHLLIDWTATDRPETAYWEVQASTNAKEFTTIGYVMGENPTQPQHFNFKNKLTNIKPGYQYYRVLQVENDQHVYTSNMVKLTK